MTFQTLDNKERKFLDLNDNDNLPTKPTYSKDGIWLNFIEHSNMSYMGVTRAITNHTVIGKH